MYIEKYWGNYIGGTDDSLTLLDYLTDKQRSEIALSEIFADTGLDKQDWDFRKTIEWLQYTDQNGMEHEFYYAIDLVTDLAALMLECSVNGSVPLGALLDNDSENTVRITFTEEEKTAIDKALADFAQNPLEYDLHEMVPEEDMQEMAQDCENLRKELSALEIPQEGDEEDIDARGWDAITKAFEKLYPGQDNPLHFAPIMPWVLGGNDPLQGISVYDGGDYWHFVSYGLSELYEKESNDPEWSGYGFEFTLKLKKEGLADEDAEIKTVCGIFQALARLTFQDGEIFQPDEYIYTGQTQGMDNRQQSKLTGFITAWDEAGEITTPNGKVQFVKLIGATDPELKAVCNKEIRVSEIAERIGSDLTDYTRDSVI